MFLAVGVRRDSLSLDMGGTAGEIPSFQFFGSSDSVSHESKLVGEVVPKGERSLFVTSLARHGASHPAGANKRSEYI